MALRYHTQGLGVTAPFAIASVVGFVANVPLNYMLIFGAGAHRSSARKVAGLRQPPQCGSAR